MYQQEEIQMYILDYYQFRYKDLVLQNKLQKKSRK